VDKIIERLKTEFNSEDARYAYADTVTNAFLTGQIKALREERDLTQEQLAELVGTQQSGVSRWLNSGFSTCKVETLRKFARAYGVRLRISFEEFGTLPSDVGDFTKERLAPRKFEDDPAFKEQPQEVAVTNMQPAMASLAGLINSPEDRALFGQWYEMANLHFAGYLGGAGKLSDVASYGPWLQGPPMLFANPNVSLQETEAFTESANEALRQSVSSDAPVIGRLIEFPKNTTEYNARKKKRGIYGRRAQRASGAWDRGSKVRQR
jgi:transcriptional regulator with XRE-family HTH domain